MEGRSGKDYQIQCMLTFRNAFLTVDEDAKLLKMEEEVEEAFQGRHKPLLSIILVQEPIDNSFRYVQEALFFFFRKNEGRIRKAKICEKQTKKETRTVFA